MKEKWKKQRDWALPPQALLAVDMDGVLCTAGMKGGWRSNRSLVRFGTLWIRGRAKDNHHHIIIQCFRHDHQRNDEKCLYCLYVPLKHRADITVPQLRASDSTMGCSVLYRWQGWEQGVYGIDLLLTGAGVVLWLENRSTAALWLLALLADWVAGEAEGVCTFISFRRRSYTHKYTHVLSSH